jgi:hypothetical protein
MFKCKVVKNMKKIRFKNLFKFEKKKIYQRKNKETDFQKKRNQKNTKKYSSNKNPENELF